MSAPASIRATARPALAKPTSPTPARVAARRIPAPASTEPAPRQRVVPLITLRGIAQQLRHSRTTDRAAMLPGATGYLAVTCFLVHSTPAPDSRGVLTGLRIGAAGEVYLTGAQPSDLRYIGTTRDVRAGLARWLGLTRLGPSAQARVLSEFDACAMPLSL